LRCVCCVHCVGWKLSFSFVCSRQGSSKSNRSSRSDRGPSGPSSPKLDRHPSLRFSVKKHPATSGSSGAAGTTSGGSRNENDPYTILTSLHRQAAQSSSYKSSPVEFYYYYYYYYRSGGVLQSSGCDGNSRTVTARQPRRTGKSSSRIHRFVGHVTVSPYCYLRQGDCEIPADYLFVC